MSGMRIGTLQVRLCELLNEREGPQPDLLLTKSDRKWLKAIDRAFRTKVKHV